MDSEDCLVPGMTLHDKREGTKTGTGAVTKAEAGQKTGEVEVSGAELEQEQMQELELRRHSGLG
jgi:hypothetical protein